MSQQIASLYAEIGAKIDGFQNGAKTVKSGMNEMKSQFSAIIPASVLQFATLGGAILAVGKGLYDMEKAADAAARGDARLQAVLKSTGEAAGYNFSQLDQMADSLSKVSGVDDDLIKKSMAVQATFTNISGNIFPAATKAALDLSAVLGTDLQGATIQVDKALNDFSGYTVLKRAGVSFSEEQIKQIENFKKTNDLAGYQKLVLAELTKEFGGAAAAIHNAGDKSEDVAIAWGNLTEEAGGGLVPALRGINVYLTESINGWNRFFQGLQRADDGMAQFINGAAGLAVNLVAPLKILSVISDWGNQMNANNTLEQTMNDAAVATDNAAKSNMAYVPTAEEVEAANKSISEANMAMVSTIQSMQDAEESFAKRSQSLTQDRLDAEQKMRDALASGNELTIEEYNGLQSKIDEVKAKEADLAAERDKQTLQFISNILLQKLEVDGLTTAEFEAFAKQQEAWGLWSADVVEKAQAAWMEADKVAASIAAIPSEKTSTITTVHVDTYGDGLVGPPKPPGYDGSVVPPTYDYQRGGPSGSGHPLGNGDNIGNYTNWWDAPWNQYGGGNINPYIYGGSGTNVPGFSNMPGIEHADGGSFMIPMSYGNEGFRMGGRDTASGGELITITPANKQSGQGLEIDYDRMARAFRDALQELGR